MTIKRLDNQRLSTSVARFRVCFVLYSSLGAALALVATLSVSKDFGLEPRVRRWTITRVLQANIAGP
jgi:hypothetical protein